MAKFLLDFLPIIAFFVIYKLAQNNLDTALSVSQSFFYWLPYSPAANDIPILLATASSIVISLLGIAYACWKKQTIDKMVWASLVLVLIFGSATILFHNELFIKLKPSVLYWGFGVALLGAKLWKKNLIYSLLSSKINLSDENWSLLNFIWASYFITMGFINIAVALLFSTDVWVNFKFYSVFIMLAFLVIQGIWLNKRLLSK